LHRFFNFFSKHLFRRLCTDFLETLPYDDTTIGLSAIENLSFTFTQVPLKEFREQKPYFGDFLDIVSRFCNIIPYCEEILDF